MRIVNFREFYLPHNVMIVVDQLVSSSAVCNCSHTYSNKDVMQSTEYEVNDNIIAGQILDRILAGDYSLFD